VWGQLYDECCLLTTDVQGADIRSPWWHSAVEPPHQCVEIWVTNVCWQFHARYGQCEPAVESAPCRHCWPRGNAITMSTFDTYTQLCQLHCLPPIIELIWKYCSFILKLLVSGGDVTNVLADCSVLNWFCLRAMLDVCILSAWELFRLDVLTKPPVCTVTSRLRPSSSYCGAVAAWVEVSSCWVEWYWALSWWYSRLSTAGRDGPAPLESRSRRPALHWNTHQKDSGTNYQLTL